MFMMAFAITQANRWSADEEDGRLELLLAAPQPRVSVILDGFAALATATVGIGLTTLVTTIAASQATNVKLDDGNVAAATLGMIPLGLLVAGLGYLFSGWLRTAVDTGLLSFLLVIWFFISFVGPEMDLPDAAMKLSPLYYYGTPLINGLHVAEIAGVTTVAAALLGLGALRFARKDIGR